MDETNQQPITIISGADSFGCKLKDTLLTHLRTLPHIQIHDLGTSSYYSIAEQVAKQISQNQSNSSHRKTIGLLACGTGVGVSIFANKFPNIYAATCLTPDDAINARSINNANVLSLSGLSTDEQTAFSILNAFLNTDFKSPCPASSSNPWPEEIESFLDNSLPEMALIGRSDGVSDPCYVCSVAKAREGGEEGFEDVEVMPGGRMRILREKPTSAIVRFAKGSVEPSHYHTFGHDVVVLKGRKCVWNLSKGDKYELGVGDYLFTGAGELHRVKYYEDTEFFIKWDGGWDLFLDEGVDDANKAIDSEDTTTDK